MVVALSGMDMVDSDLTRVLQPRIWILRELNIN